MFRQHLVPCNCQLFSPQHYQNYEYKEFRSPPAHTTRKATKQKRSLKRHSHSRNRIIQQNSKFMRNSQKYSLQNDRNMKVEQLLSRQPSNMSGQSGYQFKPMTDHVAKISLLNSKKGRKEADQMIHKQNNANTIPIRSIRYQTRVSSPEPNQNIEVLKEIASISNIPQNNCFIRMPEPLQPLYSSKQPKYRQCSAETTLAGSIVPTSIENLQKAPTRLPHYFKNKLQAHISDLNKNNICQQKDKLRHSNFFKLSRLSEMISDRQETQSVYQGQKTHDQGGVQFSRVLISYKKLMQQQNGVLQQTQRTKLFEYYPQPSIRSNQSSTFQKIHLMPSNLRS